MNFICAFRLLVILLICITGCKSLEFLPSSCAELSLQGNRVSGIYTIHPRKWFNPTPFKVYCDMETDGGGWTVFQRRDDVELRDGIRENFTRNWTDYKNGFGDLEKEFWLGNEFLFVLTNQDRVSLRIDMEDFDGNSRVAEYNHFYIENSKKDYVLALSDYEGDAGDSFSYHNGAKFMTFDKNNYHSCSTKYKGGWWYKEKDCYNVNLNGFYAKGTHTGFVGITWHRWLGYNYSLKRIEMKVRPVLDEYYKTCFFNGCPEITQMSNVNLKIPAKELNTTNEWKPFIKAPEDF